MLFNYRIQLKRVQDGEPEDWDFIDRMILLYGVAWALRAAKEVALAYAKNK